MTLPEILKNYGVKIAYLVGSQEFEKDSFEAARDDYFEIKNR